MSTKLIALSLLSTKALVNTYTWLTLPLYTITSRPWKRLHDQKSFGVKRVKDDQGRIIYSRPCPIEFDHPIARCSSFNEMVPFLNRNQIAVGIREVLGNQTPTDANGKSIMVEGKVWKQINLAESYRWMSVGQIMDRVDSIARGLRELGLSEREKVLIYADNSGEWFCTALALLRLNAVTVTLLSILNDEALLYGIDQIGAKFMIIGEPLLPRFNRINPRLNANIPNIIYVESNLANKNQSKEIINELKEKNCRIMSFEQVEQSGSRIAECEFTNPDPDDVSLIVYTSGTTGNHPKGVMITHRNMVTSMMNLIRYQHETKVKFLADTVYASYLPMTHLFGYRINLASFISENSRFGLCTPATMFDWSPSHPTGQIGDLQLVKPEFMPAVPLILERILKQINQQLNVNGRFTTSLFTYLMEYKIRWTARGFDTPLIDRFVCKRVKELIGGRLESLMVSSAPLNPRTQALIRAAFNINLIQTYGATEVTAGTHATLPNDLQDGECGVPLHSVRYYLKDWPDGGYYPTDQPNPRGEIIVGGETVSQGYFQMTEETAASFYIDNNGERWFETGDIGEVLPNGTLMIIDRKRDLQKLANGEFVSLGKIESTLRKSSFVENICVCTHRERNHVVAIISPNRVALIELGRQMGLCVQEDITNEQTLARLCADQSIMEHIRSDLWTVGLQHSLVSKEIPVTITIVADEWSSDNNLLTTALKLRRKRVNEFYQTQINRMFNSTEGGN